MKGIISLNKILLYRNNVKSFSLSYKNGIKNRGLVTDLVSIYKILKRFFSKIDVQFSIKDDDICYYFKGLKTSKNSPLETSLSYIRSPYSQEDPTKLFTSLQKLASYLKNIKKINFNFNGWTVLNNNHLLALKDLPEKHLQLSDLSINLSKYFIPSLPSH